MKRIDSFKESGIRTTPRRARSLALGLVMVAACLAAFTTASYAALVGLTNATASFEQTNYDPANRIWKSIDGVFYDNCGWGLYPQEYLAQTAVFQTSNPGSAGNAWVFDLYFYQFAMDHKIQKFRLSATTDANPTVSSGATWTELTPSLVSTYWAKPGGTLTSTINPDKTVLISGLSETSGYQAIWTVHASGLLNPTGFRLEVFPVDDNHDNYATIGFQAGGSNGNITLSEFTVNAVPLPPSMLLLGSGLMGLLGVGLRWRKP